MEGNQILRVAIIDDELFDAHIPITDLPEKPRRTKNIRQALKAAYSASVQWMAPVSITRKDLEEIHAPRYVEEVFSVCAKRKSDAVSWISNDHEVLVSQGSLPAILCAAGAAQQAVRMVLDPINPVTRVFCNVRPPGHHAHQNKGQGFCIFNNVWIGACEARKLGAQRVAIIDWDVHHGNGTQDFILGHANEADTLFFSIHQDHRTIWPGTGKKTTKGHHGTVKCGEMLPGADDVDIKRYFASEVLPALQDFKPDLVLVSCGFDAHIKDQISKLNYTSDSYEWMTKQLVEVFKRIVLVLEGGYCVPALRECAVKVVGALL